MTFVVDAHHIGAQQTGNETWARNTCRELAQLAQPGELCFVGTATGQRELAELTAATPAITSAASTRRLAVDLPRIARRVDAEAILVQYTMPLTRRPCVVAVHDLSVEDARASLWLPPRTRLRIRASIRASARYAAHLLATSHFTKSDLVARYGVDPDRISVATAAVDPELARLLTDRAHGKQRRRPFVVLTVGNVVPRKNLLVVGRAVAALRDGGRDLRLRVVGSVGPRGTAIAEQLQELLGNALSTTGYVGLHELANEYLRADVLAFPSLYEGFGIPAIEAMMAGLPTVVSDATSLPEVVGDAGLVVAADDAQAWTGALSRVHDDHALHATLVARGREQAHRFSWRATAEVVLGALRQSRRRADA